MTMRRTRDRFESLLMTLVYSHLFCIQTTIIQGVYAQGGAVVQTDSALLLSGACGEGTLCDPGERLSLPEDCSYYYQCSELGAGYQLFQCASGEQFDVNSGRCTDPGSGVVLCSTDCDGGVARYSSEYHHVSARATDLNTSLFDDYGSGELDFVIVEEPLIVAMDATADVPPTPTPAKDPVVTTAPVQVTTPETTVTTTTKETTTAPPLPSTKPDVTTVVTSSKTTLEAIPPVPSSARPSVLLPGPTDNPSYDIVTEQGSQKNDSLVVPDGGDSGGANAALIGAVAGGLVLLLLIIGVVIFLLLRRRKQQKKSIARVENPHYNAADKKEQTYRFSRDSALCVTPNSNNNKPSNFSSDKKAKRSAPGVPVLSEQRSSKRRAPAPPNPFTGEVDDFITKGRPATDIYEKDNDSDNDNVEMSTFNSVKNTSNENKNAPEDEPEATDPLLGKKDKETEDDNDADIDDKSSEDVEKDPKDKDSGTEDMDQEDSASLDKEKAETSSEKEDDSPSKSSVDDYDVKNNPFYSDEY